MKPSRLLPIIMLAALLGGPMGMAQAQDQKPGGTAEQLGQVHFPVSCSAAAQQQFHRAVALLHSFWYAEAVRAFTAVTQTDPSCAMAYWGIAMSLWYPLWEPPTKAALKQGWTAVEKAKALGGKTERERDYIAAIEAFYKDSDKLDHRTRAVAYEKGMEQVYHRHPDDREAAIFYALALNATALPTDKTYANQLKAGQILEKIFAQHPGWAHYLIHSYDSPPLASRGLTAARVYAKIAPAAPHALHMPSHIFTRLGLWQESIQSNRASADAAKADDLKARPGVASSSYMHPLDYLAYAYLQGAQDRKAKEILEEVMAVQKAQEVQGAAYAFAAVPARYAIERRRWSEAASLMLHPSAFAWSRYRMAEAITYFSRALGAARSGDAAGARKEAEKLQAVRDALTQAKSTYWANQVEVQRRAATAWAARVEGKNDEALTLLRAAADLEDSMEKHPVTPAPIVPARELLAELLLELREPGQALKEFEAALGKEPNRFNGLYGAARAAELSGDREKARTFYAKLVTLSAHADTERPELREAKASLAKP